MHFCFSAFCFSPVPYFTLCFRHTVLNALTAPNFKILFWGQIKAVQSHYVHYCTVWHKSFPSSSASVKELSPLQKQMLKFAPRSTGRHTAALRLLLTEFWHRALHHNVLGSRLQGFFHS